MKAINNLDLEMGNSEIPISVYSAVETETSFKQLSKCCDSAVNYKKVCNSCKKELSAEEIYKAIEVGKNEFKKVNTEEIKVENTSLKVLGITDDESEENGYVKNGTTWFLGIQMDMKNKGKTERNSIKFSYLREALRESKKSLVCIVAVRGKEHLILVKPYFNGLIGVGVYYLEQIRTINEISGYDLNVAIDKNVIFNMSENLKLKNNVIMKDILNKRSKIIEKMISESVLSQNTESEEKETETEKVNVEDLVNF